MATAVGSHFCIFTAEFACLCRGFPQPGSDVDQNGVQTQSGEVGTIEVTEEAKEGIGTGTGITDDSQKESAKTEETLPDKPIYREVRRNGITYIEKVGKETLQKESKEQEAQDEQLAARMQQQKEIAEAQNRKAPGRSFLTPDDGAGIVDEYDKLANQLRDMRI